MSSPSALVESKQYASFIAPPSPPQEKVYVTPTDLDVLRGRGGRTNTHPGNQRLLELVRPLESRYASLKRGQKGRMSEDMVDTVYAWEGRFLEREKDNGTERYFIMDKHNAIKLVEQKFRDEPNKRKRKCSNQSRTAANRSKRSKVKEEEVPDVFDAIKKSLESWSALSKQSMVAALQDGELVQSNQEDDHLVELLATEGGQMTNIVSPSHLAAEHEEMEPSIPTCGKVYDSLESDLALFDDYSLSDFSQDSYALVTEIDPSLLVDPSSLFQEEQVTDVGLGVQFDFASDPLFQEFFKFP